MKNIVLNEGDGIVINSLYNQWDKVKNRNDYLIWQEKIKNTMFGTYKSIGLLETIKKFNPQLSDYMKKQFLKEIENTLK